MRTFTRWFGFLPLLLLACGSPAAPAGSAATTGDAAADVAADVTAVPDSAGDAPSGDVAVVPDAAADAATDVLVAADADAAPDAAPDDATDVQTAELGEDAADALPPDDAADVAADATAVADAVDAADAADSADASDAEDAADAAADVDAGPLPLGLNDAVTLTAPADGTVVNVGASVTVSYAFTAPPPAGSWTIALQLGTDATTTAAFNPLPQTGSQPVQVTQPGPQQLRVQFWQDGVLVAEKTLTLIGNLPPTGVPALAVTPAPATVQADLQAAVTQPSLDPEGAPLTWTWQWLKDGQPTTFVGPTVPKQWLQKGQTWTVTASASDGYASGPVGQTTVVIVNSPPTAVVLAEDPTSVALTGAATATILSEGSDADGDPLTLTFAWTWQGQPVGATPTLDVPTVLLNGQHLTPGDLQLTVTVADGDGGTAVTHKTVAILATPVCGTSFWSCDAHATCKDDGTLTPPCTCQGGWLGDGKTCLDIDECSASPCAADAKCVNSPGSFSCSCLAGFTGNGFACSDVDECANQTANCAAMATCQNTPGSFTCTCKPGYAGNGQQCADVDECATKTDNCDVNATCSNTVGSFQCACNAGWAGSGTSCSDVNECADPALNACDPHANCLNGPGGYDCACASGWTGSGLSCTDVDECALGTAGCDVHATCQNTPGSYTCSCGSGYTGSGKSCSDVNECTAGTATCDANATCGNTDGGYVCACNAGYTGDGKSCSSVCDLYCAAVTANCTGGNQQYADLASCQTTCKSGAAWTLGQVGDTSGDSVYCRYGQAGSAALLPASFCSAAGPSGGGVCGSPCDAYCDLMDHACAGAYASASACQTACAAFPTSGLPGATSGNSLQCRASYALQAVTSATPATSCSAAGTVSSACSTAVDVSGWHIDQTNSTQTYVLPTGTTVNRGGYLILSRASAKADFEAFWGVTLGPDVVFVQSAATAGATTACPQINGSETYSLSRSDATVIDGPTVAMPSSGKFIFNRTDLTQPTGSAAGWSSADYTVKTNATPGSGQTPGKVNGPYISEFADAFGTNNFVYEFVEIYFDPGP